MSEGFEKRLRRRVLGGDTGSPARLAAAALAELVGETLAGVIFFGSRKSGAGFNRDSAWDFFVVTRGYRGFYDRLRTLGRLKRGPGLVAALNTVLPPNMLRLLLEVSGEEVTGKCAVIDLAALERETSVRRWDHFCAGRLFQPVEIVHAADAVTAERLFHCVMSAHRETWRWVRPWLPKRFDVDAYYRRALEVSMAGEIRPESSARAHALWEAQSEHRRAVYPALLDELGWRGELAIVATEAGAGSPGGGDWRPVHPPGILESLRLRLYFAFSKTRATLRWFKYVATFDEWLDYIVRKVERHTGRRIALTPAQRRYPLVLLWPALFRHRREKEKGL